MARVKRVKDKYQYYDRAGNPVGKPQKTRSDAERVGDKNRAHSVVSPKAKAKPEKKKKITTKRR